MPGSRENTMVQNIDLEIPIKILTGDRRLTIRLMGLWKGSRLGSEPYVRADVFLDSLSEDLLDDCCIVEIAAHGECELRRIGKTIGRRSAVNGETATVADLPPKSLLAVAVRQLKDACTFGAPILDEGETRGENGGTLLYRSILLPLCEEGGRTVQFLAAARCREKVDAA